MTNSSDLLVRYYDALSDGNLEIICECFDIPSKIISLYGLVNINSKDDILKTYSNLINSWKEQNISSKVGYDRDAFLVSNIQKNVDLVKTKLTNFDLEGKLLQEWNCTYVIQENNNQWLISLGTTDNRKTISFK
tara:strand:- start:791 stop:1192 length:402 start_codon:yes stop_codon:yes gene_type:complete